MSTWRDGRLHLDEVPITDGPHHAVSRRKRRFGLLRLSRRLECANSIVFGYGLGGFGRGGHEKATGNAARCEHSLGTASSSNTTGT